LRVEQTGGNLLVVTRDEVKKEVRAALCAKAPFNPIRRLHTADVLLTIEGHGLTTHGYEGPRRPTTAHVAMANNDVGSLGGRGEFDHAQHALSLQI